jgi:hypothetical protein
MSSVAIDSGPVGKQEGSRFHVARGLRWIYYGGTLGAFFESRCSSAGDTEALRFIYSVGSSNSASVQGCNRGVHIIFLP